jgi:REP element-mobilizing transposase RayT
MKSVIVFQPVFHIYNRSNDRATLFTEDRYYNYFLKKVDLNFAEVAHLLGYCLMPNHFHFLLTPKHPVTVKLTLDGKPLSRMPNKHIGEAVRRTLMGFTKGFNNELALTGSRFQQRTKCKYHHGFLGHGLDYVHFNPTEAKLVDHPGEWGYSSYNEYSGLIDSEYCLCNIQLGKSLLLRGF